MTGARSNWKEISLGELGKWITGSTPKSSNPLNFGNDVDFVTPSDIGYGGLLGPSERKISHLGASSVRKVKAPSVNLVCIGTIGKVALARRDVTTNQQINSLEVDKSVVDPNFVMWLLASPEIQEKLWESASSTTVAILNKGNLEKIKTHIPSLPEQQKIVEILEDHLSRLDAALADVKQAKLKAAQFRRSLLQTAFTGNLTGDGTRIMTEWKVESIGDVCSFITDGSHNPPKGISQSEYFMLSSKDIQDGHLVFNNPRFLSEKDFEIENNRTKLQLDDVLLTTVGTIGRTAIYRGVPAKVTFQRSVSILRPVREKITPQYLKYFFDSITHVLTRESRGVAQQGIYLNQLKKIQVSYPPLPEQQKIVEILEDHLSRLNASVAIADAMEKQSASLRRSLLQAAFTGQLTKEVASV